MSIRVLIACEASGKTCCAFRRLGYTAFSCDIQDTYGVAPQWHIKGDALQVINDNWDLIISHPPCTYLSRCQGNLIFDRVNGSSVIIDSDRFSLGLQAVDFFMKMLNAPAPFICVENPRPLKVWGLPKPSCTIQPFEFGHPYTKATCLWLKGLPPLMPTDLFDPSFCRSWMRCVPGFSKRTKYKQARLRSETFQGISNAFAEQYGSFVSAALCQPSVSSMVGV